MNIFTTYIKGWGLSFQHLKLWGFLYLVNFLFALLVSFPVFRFLNAKLSHSMALDKMFEQFDFTVYHDIMNEYGDVVDFLMNQGIITSFFFLLVSVFLVGGILNVFRHRSVSFRFAGFWTGGAKYYWRFFGLTLLFLFIQGIIAVAFFSIFNVLTAGGLDRFHSEAEIYKRAFMVFPFYLFVAMIFWMIQDYVKVVIVDKDYSLFRGVGQGIRFVFKNFLSVFGLYLLNLLTFGLIFYLYWRTPSSNSVAFTLLIGQLFLLFRIGMKMVNLATATLWYDSKETVA